MDRRQPTQTPTTSYQAGTGRRWICQRLCAFTLATTLWAARHRVIPMALACWLMQRLEVPHARSY